MGKKKILITGCDGFIASHLIKYFEKKNFFVIATHYKKIKNKNSKNVIYKHCDIRNRSEISSILKKFKPNEIYHLAAKSLPSFSFRFPIETFKTNVIGTLNILEEIRLLKIKTKILIACSSGQYGSRKLRELPLSEKHFCNPEHLYGLSKSFQNQLGLQYYKMYNMKVYGAIIFNTTGPGKSSDVFSDFCKQFINNKIKNNKKIIDTGDLNKYRDFLHVNDLVRGFHLITAKGKAGEAYNLCSSKYYKVQEIIKLMSKQAKFSIVTKTKKNLIRKFDEKYIFGSNKKIKKIGWEPKLTIKDIFNDMCEYYEKKKKFKYFNTNSIKG